MGTADFYPLYNGYDNADEIEVSTETLEKYLAGEITMDDVDFSKHKLLKNDMEAVKELKKEPYDDFSLDKWNLDSDIAKTNLPRLVSLLVGGSPLVMINMYRFTMHITVRQKPWRPNGQTLKKWKKKHSQRSLWEKQISANSILSLKTGRIRVATRFSKKSTMN